MKQKNEINIGLGSAILVFLLFLIPTLDIFELATLDYRFRQRPNHHINPAIVLIGIDDQSVEKVGRWPWPRSYHGQMVEALDEAGAKVIGFDILFSEHSESPSEDQALSRAMSKKRNVLLPFYFKKLEKKPTGLFSGSQPVSPIPILASSSAGAWPINTPPDRDGITRSVPLVIQVDDRLYPNLGLALTLTYLNASPEGFELTRSGLKIDLPQNKKLTIPIDNRGRMTVNFAGDCSAFPIYPYETVLLSYFQEKSGEKPDIPMTRFKNKIILIGPVASGIGDLRPTPVNPLFPMFAIHANTINNILENDFLIRPNPAVRFLILFLLGLAVAAIVRRERLLRGVLFSLLLIVIYLLTSLWLFTKNIQLDVVAPFSVVFLACLSGTLNNFLTERREKNYIRSIFQRYVAQEVVTKLLSEKDALKLGGDRRKVTVIFADIHGFTPISENLPPEEVVQFLNESFSVIVAAAFKYKGTLDKFIGDCVMAVFGAPLTQEDQELAAIKAALEMKKDIVGVSEKWSARLGVKVEIGIGINTGEAVIGNIGSVERMDYTAIGDAVNLAQRLQSLATAGQIMVSETTFQAVAEFVEGTAQPPAQIKGKSKPVLYYEVHGLK